MKGLYISFIIKRRRKLDKIMDYFLALALGMLLFTFAFYIQYVGKENKYNSLYIEQQTQQTILDDMKKKVEASTQESATAIEKAYDVAYNELEEKSKSISIYTTYIHDLYNVKINGVTINGVTMDPIHSTITLSLYFDRSVDSQVDYRYRAAILDLDWVPAKGVNYEDTNANTTWEVLVDGTGTKN